MTYMLFLSAASREQRLVVPGGAGVVRATHHVARLLAVGGGEVSGALTDLQQLHK